MEEVFLDEELEILEPDENLDDQEEEIQRIVLHEYQEEHYKKILSILQNEPGYLDVSQFGTGYWKL